MSPPLIRSDTLSVITVLCHSIPQALTFYVGQLGMVLKCDEMVGTERYVVAAPANLCEFTPQAQLRFREAVTERDRAAVGNQGGDGIFLQFESDFFDQVMEKIQAMGTTPVGGIRTYEKEGYKAATLVDPMGNLVNFLDHTTRQVGRVFRCDVGF
jgi:catechol 2,3-dioxygenase-like lactoylglutathione lyase family enzyme